MDINPEKNNEMDTDVINNAETEVREDKEDNKEEKTDKNENGNNEPEEKKQDPFLLFPMRYAKFCSFYQGVVLISFAGIIAAICSAIYGTLLWGAIFGAASIFFYFTFTSNELIERLGLSYKTKTGSLEITYCRRKYGDVFFIPSKLVWYDVERIGDNAFRSEKNAELLEIYIPKSIKSIGKDILGGCRDLTAIRYEGSEEEWNSIESETDFSGVNVTFNAVFPAIPQKEKDKRRSTPEK